MGHVENQLWRLRWWGWEAVGKPGEYTNEKGGRTFDAAAAFTLDAGCYYYRTTGSGYTVGFDGVRYSAPRVGINFDQRYLKHLPPGCGAKW